MKSENKPYTEENVLDYLVAYHNVVDDAEGVKVSSVCNNSWGTIYNTEKLERSLKKFYETVPSKIQNQFNERVDNFEYFLEDCGNTIERNLSENSYVLSVAKERRGYVLKKDK